MSNGALADLVASTGPILLDFDGPVTQLLPPPANAEIARLARQPLLHEGIRLPSEIAETTDHIAVLRFAGAIGGESQARVEGLCIAAEVGAARRAVPTVGVIAMLRAAQVVARPVSIVSNNHRDAVEAFLVTHKLLHLVHSIFGRVDGAPELMKPDPYVVKCAINLLHVTAERCVLIGDSISDVEAGHAAGVKVIGFAKTVERGRDLSRAGAEAITPDNDLLGRLILRTV